MRGIMVQFWYDIFEIIPEEERTDIKVDGDRYLSLSYRKSWFIDRLAKIGVFYSGGSFGETVIGQARTIRVSLIIQSNKNETSCQNRA